MPSSQHHEGGRNPNFILCFYSKEDKYKFLKYHKKNKEINIDNYTYINFKIRNLWNTNMVQCKAKKNYNILHHLDLGNFSEKVPF